VRAAFPELIFSPPAWLHTRQNDWTKVIPKSEDVQFLANLTHHADMNMNLGSTMTLDFGLHDKPVVNVAFDISDPPLFGMPVYDYYYNYEHFRPVVEFHASRIARTAERLPEHVNAYLADPALDREGRRRLVDMHVDVQPGQSCKATVAALERISAN
jgi:acid phosphatase class B